ncbi:MAG: hypothetical protein JSW68_07520 [Burkholderiales bacterium]|nr:MAG: hypothetical protein JSW68_07520 [Burkholderiales bacterium]
MGNELLIVDQGAQRLYRFDLGRMALTPWPLVAVGPGMRVALARDGSAWVLDPASARLVRFAPDGRVLLTLRDPNLFPSPIDFGLRVARAEVVLLDATLGHWVTVRYGAGPGLAIASRGPWADVPAAPRALAVGSERLCVGVAAAPSLVCLPDGARTGGAQWQVLADDIAVRPGTMVLDRHGRLFVADDRGATLHVYSGAEPVARIAYATLGLTSIAGMAVDGNVLAVADAAAARVALFFIKAPLR